MIDEMKLDDSNKVIEKQKEQIEELFTLCESWKIECDNAIKENDELKNPELFEKEEYQCPDSNISDSDRETIDNGIDRLLTDFCNFVERSKETVKKEMSINEFLYLRNHAILDGICIKTGGSILNDKVYQIRLEREE